MTEPRTTSFDLRSHVRTLLVHKWLILAVTLAVGGAVTLWTLRQAPIYQARTTIEYDPDPSRPLGDSVQDVADPVGHYWSSREFFATQNRILSSQAIAERVVRQLGLHEDPGYWHTEEGEEFEPRTVEDAGLRVRTAMSVEPIRDTRIVAIVVQDESAERAQAIADAFADAYIAKTMEDRMGSTVSALEWLAQQLDTLRRELDEAEMALHAFKEDHQVLSVSLEDRQNLLAREMESFNEALTEARQKRIEASARVRRLREALTGDILVDTGVVGDDVQTLERLREALQEKLAERDRLASTLGAAHPDLVALDTEVTSIREQLQQELETIVRSAEADLREMQSIEGGMRSALDRAREAGLELNRNEIAYRRLNRARENKTKLYELVLQRTTETDLTRMMRTTHVRIVDRAMTPATPISPNVPTNIGAGVLGGLLLGMLLAFGVRQLDRRLRTPEAIEELGVTVLGVLPRIGNASSKERRNDESKPQRRRRRAATRESPDLFVHENPMSTAAECCRTIRTNLTFMAASGQANDAKVIVVSSSEPREGKTTVVSNLAASIAHSGKSVLVIDTDLRRPRVHTALSVNRDPGVSSVLVGELSLDQAVRQTSVEGLDVLASGPIPPNPSELLHLAAFGALIDAVRDRYDYVIFDSPPLGAVTDAAIISPQVDGTLLVVQASHTTRDSLRSALRQLNDVGARLLGVIVNDVDLETNRYGGSYYTYRVQGTYYYSDEQDDLAAE